MMKVLKGIKDFIFFVLGTIFFIFALTMTILLLNFNDYGLTQFGDNTFVIISNEIANDEFEKGDLVIVESRGLENYKEGDTIFAYRVDNKRNIHVDQGVVGNIYTEERALAFENGNTYGEEFIAGVPKKTYEEIGTFLGVVESKWGFLFIVLVPSFLIFLYEVYALIIEIKYGAEEEEEEEEYTKKKEKKNKKNKKVEKNDEEEGDEDDGRRSSSRKEESEEEVDSGDKDKASNKKNSKNDKDESRELEKEKTSKKKKSSKK